MPFQRPFAPAAPASSRAALVLLALSIAGCAAQELEGDGEGTCLEPHGEEPIGEARGALSKFECKQSTDKGYKSGKAFDITVVTVDGKKVELHTANAYFAMAKAAEKDGVQIRIVSGFRTMKEQKYLYGCYTSCSCNNCNLAAKPGYSNHQSGHALDLNTSAPGVYAWLKKHGGKFGFKRTVPSEAWHWEWWGGGPKTAICGEIEAELAGVSSDAKPADDGEADYEACASKPFSFSLELENTGDVRWVDRADEAEGVGQRVRLATPEGEVDALTGLTSIDLAAASNADVRPKGYPAKESGGDCATDKCRRTRFEVAALPAEPGLYTTRWRLEDASPGWKEPKPFGPVAELRVRVVECAAEGGSSGAEGPPPGSGGGAVAPEPAAPEAGPMHGSCALGGAPAKRGLGNAALLAALGLCCARRRPRPRGR